MAPLNQKKTPTIAPTITGTTPPITHVALMSGQGQIVALTPITPPVIAPAAHASTPPTAPTQPPMKKGPLASQVRNILHERPEYPELVQVGLGDVPPTAKHVPINVRAQGAPSRFARRFVMRGGKHEVWRFGTPRHASVVHLRASVTGNTTGGVTIRTGGGVVAFGPGEDGAKKTTSSAPPGKPIEVDIDTNGSGSVVIVLTGETTPITEGEGTTMQVTRPQAPQVTFVTPQVPMLTRWGENLAAALQYGKTMETWKREAEESAARMRAMEEGGPVFRADQGARGGEGASGATGAAGLDRNQYSPAGRADAGSRTFWESYAAAVAKGLPASQAAQQMADHTIPPLDPYVQQHWPAAVAALVRELQKLGHKVEGAEGGKGSIGTAGPPGIDTNQYSPEQVRSAFHDAVNSADQIANLTPGERVNVIMRIMGLLLPELGIPGSEPPPGAGPMGPPRPFTETPFRPGTERNQYGPGDRFAGTELGLSPEEQAAEDKAKADAEAAAKKTAPIPLEKLKTALQHWIELRNNLAKKGPGASVPMGQDRTQPPWTVQDFDNKIAQLVGMIESAEADQEQQQKEEDMAALAAWMKGVTKYELPKDLGILITITLRNGDAERAAALLAYGRKVMQQGREAERARYESQVAWANAHGGSAAGWVEVSGKDY